MWVIEKLAKTVVLINLSNTYVLLSGLLRIPFQIVGIASLCVMAIYLFINRNTLKVALQHKAVIGFLVLFIVLPILSSVIAPVFLKQYVAYQLLAGFLFLTVIVWLLKDGYVNVCQWVLVSLIIGLIGIGLSYAQPDRFESVALMQQDARYGELDETSAISISTAKQGRAFGFYMQPNRASYAITAHFLVLAFLLYYSKPTTRLFLLTVCLFAILLTGSRGGFVYIGYAASILFLSEVIYGTRVRGVIRSGLLSVPRYAIFAFVGALVIGGAAFIDFKNNPEKSAVLRILETVDTLLSGNIKYDTSMVGRLIAQEYYIDGILKSPFWGHGLGGAAFDKYTGSLFLSSHNNFLETAYAYGIPMAVVMYFYLVLVAFSRESRVMINHFRMNFPQVIVGFFFICSFDSNSVFDYRVFPVLLGILLGVLCAKEKFYIASARV